MRLRVLLTVAMATALLAVAASPTPVRAGLLDHNGAEVTLEGFRGRWLLLAFGYTHCPDVCPTGLYTMARALDALGPRADLVRAAFVTVDPERDSPAVLKEYVGLFHEKLIGVSGTADSIAELAAQHRVKFVKVQVTPDHYAMDHTASFILVSPRGEQVSRLHHGLTPEALADKLLQIMSR